MLTGDNQFAAGTFARKLGIKEYYAGLLPENKVEHIERLLNKYGKVAFVGDGINAMPLYLPVPMWNCYGRPVPIRQLKPPMWY